MTSLPHESQIGLWMSNVVTPKLVFQTWYSFFFKMKEISCINILLWGKQVSHDWPSCVISVFFFHFLVLFWTLNHCAGEENKADRLSNVQSLVIMMFFGLGCPWVSVTVEIEAIHIRSNYTKRRLWNDNVSMARVCLCVWECVHTWYHGGILSSRPEVRTCEVRHWQLCQCFH